MNNDRIEFDLSLLTDSSLLYSELLNASDIMQMDSYSSKVTCAMSIWNLNFSSWLTRRNAFWSARNPSSSLSLLIEYEGNKIPFSQTIDTQTRGQLAVPWNETPLFASLFHLCVRTYCHWISPAAFESVVECVLKLDWSVLRFVWHLDWHDMYSDDDDNGTVVGHLYRSDSNETVLGSAHCYSLEKIP